MSTVRRPLIYLGVFAALALFYYYYEHKGGIERAELEQQAKKALLFSPDSAAALSIATGKGAINLERSGQGWVLVSPVRSAADSEAVARLLRSAADAAADRVVEDSAADLSIYGLERPQLTFSVTVRGGGAPRILELGNKNPGETYIYARNPERPLRVVLLNGWLLGDLDRTAFQLRDKRLLQFDKDGIERLTVTGRNGKLLEIARSGDRWELQTQQRTQQRTRQKTRQGTWQKYRADPDSVDALLDKLLDAEAAGFIDEPPPRWESVYHLDQPSLIAQLVMRDGAIHSIKFGAHDTSGNYFARYYVNRPEAGAKIFLAGPELFDLLSVDPSHFREMALVGAERESITNVGCSRGGGNWRAMRDSTGQWSFAEPAGRRLDTAGLDNYLYDLLDVRADSFIEKKSIRGLGLREYPDFKVNYKVLSAGAPYGVSYWLEFFFNRHGGNYYVSGNAFEGVAVVDSANAAKLAKTQNQMKYRKVVEFTTGAVDRITIERPGSPALELSGGEGGWRVTAPRELAAASWKVQSLLWKLADVRYERVLGQSAADSSAFGFDSPPVVLSLYQGDSLAAVRVLLGGPVEGGEDAELVALRTSADARTFAVPAAILKEIPQEPEAFTEN